MSLRTQFRIILIIPAWSSSGTAPRPTSEMGQPSASIIHLTPPPRLWAVYSYAGITCLNRDSLKSSWGLDTPCQLITCTVSANGEVIPVWQKGDSGGRFISFLTHALNCYPNSLPYFKESHFLSSSAVLLPTSSLIQ